MSAPFVAVRCGSCGNGGLIVESIAGQPWTVSCENDHPYLLTGGDIRFEIPDPQEAEDGAS